MTASDEQLLSQIASGDRACFAEFYDRHSSRVYGLLMKLCRNARVAEDAMPETFLYIWTSRANYDQSRGSPLAWLLLVARSRGLDQLRRTGRHAALSVEHHDAPQDDTAVADASRSEEAQRASTALRTLPDEQRLAIELAFYGGMTHEEIAGKLSIPLGTIKTRIRLGMQKLRDLLAA
ncbi:MAG: sigma-70 family RNA polymerase sigma factor [Phycisphaerae bacterium]